MEAVIFDMDGVIVDTEPGFFIVANKFLERYGKSITKEYFEQFFGGASVHMWKTTTEMLGLDVPVEECLKGTHEIREQCLVIEDSNNGVTAAKSAGMSVIGFQNLEVANQGLKPADHVVTSMKDITLELCRSF